jgi:hypothetical protein
VLFRSPSAKWPYIGWDRIVAVCAPAAAFWFWFFARYRRPEVPPLTRARRSTTRTPKPSMRCRHERRTEETLGRVGLVVADRHVANFVRVERRSSRNARPAWIPRPGIYPDGVCPSEVALPQFDGWKTAARLVPEDLDALNSRANRRNSCAKRRHHRDGTWDGTLSLNRAWVGLHFLIGR